MIFCCFLLLILGRLAITSFKSEQQLWALYRSVHELSSALPSQLQLKCNTLFVQIPACIMLLQVPAVLEYNIHVPPVPEGKSNALSFVCLRLTTYPKNGCNIPEHLQRRFLEVFAVQVQQFKGYMFQTCPDSLREVCAVLWPLCYQIWICYSQLHA